LTTGQLICPTCRQPIKRGDSVIWVEPPLDDPRRRVSTVHRELRHAWCTPEGWMQVSGAWYYEMS